MEKKLFFMQGYFFLRVFRFDRYEDFQGEMIVLFNLVYYEDIFVMFFVYLFYFGVVC